MWSCQTYSMMAQGFEVLFTLAPLVHCMRVTWKSILGRRNSNCKASKQGISIASGFLSEMGMVISCTRCCEVNWIKWGCGCMSLLRGLGNSFSIKHTHYRGYGHSCRGESWYQEGGLPACSSSSQMTCTNSGPWAGLETGIWTWGICHHGKGGVSSVP